MITEIIKLLKKEYPIDEILLNYNTPIELLVATMLAAQCTDKRVNIVTKELFKKYKTAKDYAEADLKELEQYIYSTGFYHNKAKIRPKPTKKISINILNSYIIQQFFILKLSGK